MVNLGSFTATLLIPELLARYGPSVAFAIPGVLMAIAVIIFYAGRRKYVNAPPTGPNPHSFTRVVGRAIQRAGTQPGHWLDAARDRHPEEAVDGAKAVFRIMGIFAGVTAFWALFDQHGASWVLQANRMDLRIGDGQMRPSQLAALNPAMVLLFIPILSRFIIPAIERRGVKVTPLGKMTVGMFLTVMSFVATAILEHVIGSGAQPHALWQIPQYVFLTAGEVLVSVTGLEFSYTQAPRSMKSTIMSIWLLTVALGNFLTGAVSKVNIFDGPAYFWFFSALMLGGALLFVWIARHYVPVEFQAAVPAGAPIVPPGPEAAPMSASLNPDGEAQTMRFNLPRKKGK
jgi:POT family proton-dependent oligopeptide transporter